MGFRIYMSEVIFFSRTSVNPKRIGNVGIVFSFVNLFQYKPKREPFGVHFHFSSEGTEKE